MVLVSGLLPLEDAAGEVEEATVLANEIPPTNAFVVAGEATAAVELLSWLFCSIFDQSINICFV
jgi:hypothetical protein